MKLHLYELNEIILNLYIFSNSNQNSKSYHLSREYIRTKKSM